MSDAHKRAGSDDCDDCDSGERGEQGERGKRGKRGPRGHDGRDGRDGNTGPTGPVGPSGLTGPFGPTGSAGLTGATGSSAPQGLAAFGYAAFNGSQIIGPNADVTFNLVTFPNFGIVPPTMGGSAFTILSGGTYQYDFFVAGVNDEVIDSLTFGIALSGIFQGFPTTFPSNQQTAQNNFKVCRGQGLIGIAAGALVTLRNRTSGGIGTVALAPNAPGGGAEAVTSASLLLKKLTP